MPDERDLFAAVFRVGVDLTGAFFAAAAESALPLPAVCAASEPVGVAAREADDGVVRTGMRRRVPVPTISRLSVVARPFAVAMARQRVLSLKSRSARSCSDSPGRFSMTTDVGGCVAVFVAAACARTTAGDHRINKSNTERQASPSRKA